MNLTLNAISRLTLGLVGLIISLVLVTYMWGMLPDRRADITRNRQRLSESLAIALLALEDQSSQERIDDFMRQVVDHRSDIQSIGIRQIDTDDVQLDVGNHAAHWVDDSASDATHQMSVPLGTPDNDDHRELEIGFVPLPIAHGWRHFILPPVQFTTLLVVFGFGVFCFYVRAIVEQLHPRQTFEAVTQLEQVVHQLNQSTAEIKRQNRELEILATRDSLTGCCNRRCFFQEFDACWELAESAGEPLAALMLDIDYFKSINDDYGHAVGDDVLRAVGQTLLTVARRTDIVSRYGGEEFAVLLPGSTLDEATKFAEKVRTSLASLQFAQLSITGSLGVSSNCQGANSPQELLGQADECLYMAKRGGRNQVIRWDTMPRELEVDDSRIIHACAEHSETSVPFRAVTALITALAVHDQETANHSRRVADLCVAVADGLLPVKECYLLETAGLLHDVGKIGVPDAMLSKSTWTDDECETLAHYDRLGLQLIETTFDCPQLTQIVVHSRHAYERNETGAGPQIPISASILRIADAYDTMLNQHSTNHRRAQQTVLTWLREGAGTQFDPQIVERFIAVLKMRDQQSPLVCPQVSQGAAMSIGLQMERLVDALEAQDPQRIIAIAKHIQTTTDSADGEVICQKASQVVSLPESDTDLYHVLQTANELLDLCRLAQRSLLKVEHETSFSVASRIRGTHGPAGAG